MKNQGGNPWKRKNIFVGKGEVLGVGERGIKRRCGQESEALGQTKMQQNLGVLWFGLKSVQHMNSV